MAPELLFDQKTVGETPKLLTIQFTLLYTG